VSTLSVLKVHGCADVDGVIAAFNDADLQLKVAIESDDDDLISETSRRIDTAIDNLFSLNCECVEEKRVLYRFLMNQFVIDDGSSATLRSRVCEKVLAEL